MWERIVRLSLCGWTFIYVPDVDATYQSALSKGVVFVQAPKDEFHGDRMGGVKRPFLLWFFWNLIIWLQFKD